MFIGDSGAFYWTRSRGFSFLTLREVFHVKNCWCSFLISLLLIVALAIGLLVDLLIVRKLGLVLGLVCSICLLLRVFVATG